jgi:hypothetical protein
LHRKSSVGFVFLPPGSLDTLEQVKIQASARIEDRHTVVPGDPPASSGIQLFLKNVEIASSH